MTPLSLNDPIRMNKTLKTIIYILAPLTAILALGAASLVWYQAIVPEQDRVEMPRPFAVSSDAFSAGLSGNLALALEKFNISEKDIVVKATEMPGDSVNNIYTITVPANLSLTLLNYTVTRMAREMGGEILRGIESADGKSLSLTLGTGKTASDILIIKKARKLAQKSIKVAIIIDDLGIKNINLAKRLCSLGQPVTLAILPFQRYTSKVIDLARDSDISYILHMPMEPKSKNVNPGKGALLSEDDASTIVKKLARAFKDVPDAEGINNHMGSKVTEDKRIMESLMSDLAKRKVFFLDSKTSHDTVGYSTSQRSGVRSAMISGYIDATNETEVIEKRLDALTELAIKNGSAIMLGHDRPLTVAALEKKIPEMLKRGISFVPLSEMVR